MSFIFAFAMLLFCVNNRAIAQSARDMTLNTIPTARHLQTGDVQLSLEYSDPYMHTIVGVQLAERFHFALRQSAETSNILEDPVRFYPGIDLRLKLLTEDRFIPAVTLGLNSATGHKRMASEYLAFSKRYHDFDFTAGLAWGRRGSAGHINNPLKSISSHFGRARNLRDNDPNGADDWFTGETIGFFGGVAYDTAWNGLTLMADIGADRYTIEEQLSDFQTPAPWSAGLRYKPFDFLTLKAALLGGEKVMTGLTLTAPVKKWPGRSAKQNTKPLPLSKHRASQSQFTTIETAVQTRENITLHRGTESNNSASITLRASPDRPLPQQLGGTARYMTELR